MKSRRRTRLQPEFIQFLRTTLSGFHRQTAAFYDQFILANIRQIILISFQNSLFLGAKEDMKIRLLKKQMILRL